MILICLKEELEDYKSEIASLENEKNFLKDKTVDDFFNSLKQQEKESLISLENDLNFTNDIETNFSEKSNEVDQDIEINEILDRPLNRIKGTFKKEIKKLIDIKIKTLESKKFKVINKNN